MQIFIKRKDKISGPFTLGQIKSGIRKSKLKFGDAFAKTEEGPWQPLNRQFIRLITDNDPQADHADPFKGLPRNASKPKKPKKPIVADEEIQLELTPEPKPIQTIQSPIAQAEENALANKPSNEELVSPGLNRYEDSAMIIQKGWVHPKRILSEIDNEEFSHEETQVDRSSAVDGVCDGDFELRDITNVTIHRDQHIRTINHLWWLVGLCYCAVLLMGGITIFGPVFIFTGGNLDDMLSFLAASSGIGEFFFIAKNFRVVE